MDARGKKTAAVAPRCGPGAPGAARRLHGIFHAQAPPGQRPPAFQPPPPRSTPLGAPSSLWPDVPSTPSLMLASGNSLSFAAVAAFEASFFGPALAQLRNASASSPTAALLRDALIFLSAWNGPSDGVQLSLLDNGAGVREHPNCPPGLPDGKVLLAPGVVALFAKGNRAEDVWVRHDALESALCAPRRGQACPGPARCKHRR